MTATRRSAALLGHLRSGAGIHSQAAILTELRRVILEGAVPPGTPIPVDQVAEVFGVSRIPVRESLRTLIGERLVDHRPNAGYLVAQLSAEEFQGLYTVRGILKKAALAAAVEHADPADYRRAEDAPHALELALAAQNHREYSVQSRRFHLARDAAALLLVAGRHLDQLDTSIAALPADTGLFTHGTPDTAAPRPRSG